MASIVTVSGFINADDQLFQRAEDTSELLKNYGYDIVALSLKCEQIINKALEILVKLNQYAGTITLDGDVSVFIPSTRNKEDVKCNWCLDSTKAPRKLTIKNTKTGKTVTFTDHQFHLIARHQYFGQRSERIDPKLLADVISFSRLIHV